MTGAPPCDPEQLADAIAGFVAHKSGIEHARVLPIVEGVIAEAGGTSAVEHLRASLSRSSDAWSYYPGDLLARRVHHRLARVVLREPPAITGVEHLDLVRDRAMIIVANHLSYSDANVIEYLLHQCGHGAIADRLAVIAGPKIYSDVSRRFSSLCFGTIKSPQNEGVSSGEASMSARDVAIAARQTLAAAHARVAGGDALLIFPEGTRSRTGHMEPFLAGVSRYFAADDLAIVPIGVTGSEHMWAIGESRLGSAKIAMSIGPSLTVASVRSQTGDSRRGFVDVLGAAVAAQLPPAYRGVYAASSAG